MDGIVKMFDPSAKALRLMKDKSIKLVIKDKGSKGAVDVPDVENDQNTPH